MRAVLGMPVWAWVVLILFIYIAVKSPPTGQFLLDLIPRLISGLGNGIIHIVQTYM